MESYVQAAVRCGQAAFGFGAAVAFLTLFLGALFKHERRETLLVLLFGGSVIAVLGVGLTITAILIDYVFFQRA